MFKCIWFCIVGCLIVGIVFMGNVIFESLSDTSREMKNVQSQVKEKVLDLKKSVMEKKADMDNMLREMKQKSDSEDKGPSARESDTPSTRKTVRKIASGNAAEIDPVDDEDRRLTAEIFKKGSAQKGGLDEQRNEDQISAADKGEKDGSRFEPGPEPIDLDRMASIRDIYREALEILNSK